MYIRDMTNTTNIPMTAPELDIVAQALTQSYWQAIDNADMMRDLAEEIHEGKDNSLFAPGKAGVTAAQNMTRSYEMQADGFYRVLRSLSEITGNNYC
jgi:hypothetical protein